MITLKPYKHQARTTCKLNAVKKANSRKKVKGRVVIPTGGGKTFIECIELNANLRKGNRVHLVLAPRIALLNQLSQEYRATIGSNYLALSFHSGFTEPDYEIISWAEENTTSLQQATDEIARAKSMKKDLVIFCTYHSVKKLTGIKFYTTIADESQYCVQDNFHEEITNLKSKYMWFFTATEKHTPSNNGRGLNNEAVFGEIIDQATPSELIKAGIIVPPRIHHAAITGNNVVTEVIELTKIHQRETAKESMPKTKVLFACNGTKDVIAIHKNITEIQKSLPDFDIFTITSKHGVWVNNRTVDRSTFLKKLDTADNAIIAHYDILSEGIDVGGITGVVLMRNLTQSKLIQTIGRAVRLYKVAGKNIKKYALVTVISRNGIQDNYEYVHKIIEMIRLAGFDINWEEILETSRGKGDSEHEIDDRYNTKKQKNNNSNVSLRHYLEEEDMFAKLFALVDAGADPSKFNLTL